MMYISREICDNYAMEDDVLTTQFLDHAVQPLEAFDSSALGWQARATIATQPNLSAAPVGDYSTRSRHSIRQRVVDQALDIEGGVVLSC